MEILILCNQQDAVAYALFNHLTGLSEKVFLVTAEQLQYAYSWEHNLDKKGKGITEIILQDKTIIHSKRLKAVFNRLRYFPMAHFKNEVDRFYAQNEMSALFYSFLKNLDSALIYPVNVNDLTVLEENILYLKQQAINAGISVLDYHFTTSPRWKSSKNMTPFSLNKQTSSAFYKKASHLVWQDQPVIFSEPFKESESVWIAGEKIIGSKSFSRLKTLKKLSANLKKELIECQFTKTTNGFKINHINSFPAYAPQHVINILAELLISKTRKIA